MNRLITCFIIVFLILGPLTSFSQSYFPPRGSWESRSPQSQGMNSVKVDVAVKYAQENEYSGSKDSRIASYEGFSSEPYHEIVGPMRERGGLLG